MTDDLKVIRDNVKEQVILESEGRYDCSDEDILELINEKLLNYPGYIPYKKKLAVIREIYNSLRRFDLISDLMEDDDITDIMVNGTSEIFIEKNGVVSPSGYRFESEKKLEDVIQQIVAGHNRVVNESDPIVDVRMPDGSRVNIVLPPIAINGPILKIRKFPTQDLTMEKYIRIGTITREASEFLKKLVISGYNIFISGGTGSGKTTFLNVLSDYIPKDERIITIEDSAELRIQGIDNLVRLETRNANLEGNNEVSMTDLIKSSLRMVPDRIVVGEVRGKEVIDMLQAMNTGHDGSLSTGHANSSYDMISRLETLVLMARDIPLAAVKRQIASALDIIIHLGRTTDKVRRVMEISEVGFSDGEIVLNKLFYYDYAKGMFVRSKNSMKATGKLIRAGYEKEVIF